jgi:hypothetical protein
MKDQAGGSALSLNFVRWDGLAASLGGALFFALILWDLTGNVPAYGPDVTAALFFLVPLLWLVGLWGFWARHAERYGALGTIGLVTGLIGLAASFFGSLVGLWAELFWLLYWLGVRLLYMGLVLLGIATIRARAMPHGWAALMLILGSLGIGRAVFMFIDATMGARGLETPEAQSALGTFLSLWSGTFASVLGLLLGLGWVWLGYALRTRKAETVQQAARAG